MKKEKGRVETIQLNLERVRVCKEALMGMLSIGRSKLEVAAGVMLQPDEIMKELRRGKKPMLIDVKEAIIEHIKKYRRVRERHYGRGDTIGRVYLPGKLTIKKNV